ncbi:MAG: hydantoinase/oxoprolinase family protein, partial [Bryobacteraceae bacterium]
MRIGVDAGGTFTDFVIWHDDGRLESFKLRSDPRDPARVVIEGIRRGAGRARADVVHGSTVATNALLERKGARTVLVTTAGFEDLMAIGRQNRPELYNLTPAPRRPLIAASFGVDERTLFDGTILRRPRGLAALARTLRRRRAASVAICLLHSYANPAGERAVLKALGSLGYVCASHQVCPEYREYERASTTAINAYVGPRMDAYLAGLERERISILQSNGGFMTAAEARRQAVRTILSGPAGGVIGAVEVARRAGFTRILGFDMGGTSTDVSLADGAPQLSTEATIDGFPIRVPVLAIHTVGAGGGSIARVDEGGLLRVGPESAGADPGPACYGKGDLPTVTDAHVVLGRIASDQLAGGSLRIDPRRARAAVAALGKKLSLDPVAAAHGILRVANANMERAIRVVSVEKGHDPREFALVAFGGCGGLHACDLAASLGIRTIVVPEQAGALSALGMLVADRVRDYSCSAVGARDLEPRYRRLERQARRDIRGCRLERSADLRYTGQSYELTVAGGGDFHQLHHRIYGYSSPERAVETVTLRVRATVATPKPPLQSAAGGREKIRGAIRGPAVVADYGSTTLIAAGWTARVDGD